MHNQTYVRGFFIKSKICNNDIYLFFLFLFQLRITLEVTLCTFSMSMSDDRAVTATFNNWLACSLQLQRSLWFCAIYFKLLIFIDFWAFANPGTSGTSTIAIKLLIFFSLSLALSLSVSPSVSLPPSHALYSSHMFKKYHFFFVFRVKRSKFVICVNFFTEDYQQLCIIPMKFLTLKKVRNISMSVHNIYKIQFQ